MMNAYIIRRLHLVFLAVLATALLTSCTKPELLTAEPSALDLDTNAPSCPGFVPATGVQVSPGPALTLNWNEGTDDLSQSSAITYQIFMRQGVGSYDLISPTKIVVGATTTQITSGIQLGGTYTLFVQCKDEAGNRFPTAPANEQSVTVNDASPPSAITDLDVTNENFTSLLIAWSASDDGAGGSTTSQIRYRLYYSTTSPVSTAGAPLVTLTGTTSYSHTSLTPGTAYYYRVVAVDIADNASADSNEASGSTLTDSTAPTFVPSITLGAITTNSIVMNWTAGSDNVTPVGGLRYNIYRCAGSTSCDPYSLPAVAQTAAGAVTYNHTGLASNTIYVVGVRAVDSSNNESSNTDAEVSSTNYNSTGTFTIYPTTQEMGIRLGQGVAVGNVVGASSGVSAFPDLLVGAPNASEPGSTYSTTGCMYVFPGTAVGTFATTPSQVICQPAAVGNGANSRNFGTTIAVADMDGNGSDDIVVSSPQQNRVYIYRTIVSAGTLSISASPTNISNGATTTFGFGLCLGNSDNVGQPDVFVVNFNETCTTACGALTNTGNVSIFANASSAGTFVSPTLATSVSPTHSLVAGPNSFTLQNSEYVARSCAVGRFDPSSPGTDVLVIGSGTVDHDAAGGNNDGIVSFYRRAGANTWNYQNTLLSYNYNISGRDTLWGDGLAAGQVDGTGAPELFVSAPNELTAGGAVYGYSVTTSAGNFTLTDLGSYYYGGSDQNSNSAGYGVYAANIWGHVDGKQDLVVGAPLDDRTLTVSANGIDLGDVFTYKNTAGILDSAIQQKEFDVTSVNARINNEFGRGLCRGDVNNDGREDVIVGAPGQAYDPTSLVYATTQGSVYIYYGVPSGEIDFANPSDVKFSPGNQANANYGYSCLVMDYNGDGFDDLLVGSPYRDVGPNADRGAVFIYQGSNNSALPSIASATLNAPPLLASVNFGWSMTKGDFDNNGYDDLAVGSPLFDSAGVTDSGAVWIFWANDTTHAILSNTSVTQLLMPGGNASTTWNPSLANNMPAFNRDTITAASRVGGVVTITTSGAHGLTVGRLVTIYGTSLYNGVYTVTATPTGTTFRYNLAGANDSATLSNAYFASFTTNNIRFGYSVQAYPTVSGSLGTDLVVCARDADTGAGDVDGSVGALTDIGSCYTFEGRVNGGLGSSYSIMTSPRNEIRFPYSHTSYAANSLFFGSSMTSGDWDDDGVNDLVICAFRMRNVPLALNNVGGCFNFRGRSDGTGGFDSLTGHRSNYAGPPIRYTPIADGHYYSDNSEAGLTDFGHSVLLTDVNNNGRDDLFMAQPITDNFGGPSNLGYNSGNVLVIRGGF